MGYIIEFMIGVCSSSYSNSSSAGNIHLASSLFVASVGLKSDAQSGQLDVEDNFLNGCNLFCVVGPTRFGMS
jgi:hypothetical protein